MSPQRRAPGRAARLSPHLRRGLGVGNATGLGMAPFLVRHPVLMHNWFHAREAALARVRSQPNGQRRRAEPAFWPRSPPCRTRFEPGAPPTSARRRRSPRSPPISPCLSERPPTLIRRAALPWDALYRFAEANLSLEGQEATVALILEPHGELIDDLAETMAADEDACFPHRRRHELRRAEGADRARLRLDAAL